MSASTFLALPAEIRNQIYELALTSPQPLRIRKTVTGAPIFNQLKHANKQLYAETAHLELMYNNLLVCAESWDEPPAQMLLGWLSSIPPAKNGWIKTVTLKYDVLAITKSGMAATQDAQDDPAAPRMQHITTTTAPDFPEDAKTFRRLAEVCRANPSMRIHYQLPAWIFHEQEELIMFGHALQALFTFRENRLFHDLLEDFPRSTGLVPVLTRIVNVLDSVVAWRKDVRVRDMWADNLRFFPTHTEEDRASLKPSGLGGWDHVRKWILEGI
ncbi:hypothetical protein HBH56_013290 [Parastagonospora nodorum]|uniref:F-box domain-containing protein n=1 Tax=Phaeosphaeria nodorum (strain SN15 / ATCC MYA-4574 / FGSC 10173) TaxID=321614 RepID=A0A7U2EXC4_PHANO|nr:hypothetical protein HBH56_013290 [Parastagonospora nodorum]QRC94856.1 hypothetical protein JI435_431440 [Parastagonospora nodorum SN15]KAH3936900.1 hypothetical protein HBH54_021150 [Parastagonospora nodorum]KAH3969247.1 hypothetical protein HBH51_125710 [Parastagonospora nodorum]KAH4100612.1 hypothetical protein HBH46_149120 [Parastagonospora nodorum]